MCGEVQVPEHHLEVRTATCDMSRLLKCVQIIHQVQFIVLQFEIVCNLISRPFRNLASYTCLSSDVTILEPVNGFSLNLL
jgi:hypothetical protein